MAQAVPFDKRTAFVSLAKTYLIFLPAIATAGFAASKFAVAGSLALTCFGFLTSLFPRLLLPLAI
jgi:hypothetical protein